MQGTTKTSIVEKLVENRRKRMGKAAIKGSPSNMDHRKFLSTGSLIMDFYMGGGWFVGGANMLIGDSGFGKTTLLKMTAGNLIRQGKPVIWLDPERAFNKKWAQTLGVDPSGLLYYTWFDPDTGEGFTSGEHMGDILLDFLENDANLLDGGMIVLDSLATTTFKAIREGDMENTHIGKRAIKLAQLYDMMIPYISSMNVSFVAINHVTQAIGQTYGDPTVIPGGKKPVFYSQQIVHLTSVKREPGDNDKPVDYHLIRARMFKNRVREKQKFEVQLNFRDGDGVLRPHFDLLTELVTIAPRLGILVDENGEPAGGNKTWFARTLDSDEPIKLAQGASRTKEFLGANPEVRAKVIEAIQYIAANPKDGEAATAEYDISELAVAEEVNGE